MDPTAAGSFEGPLESDMDTSLPERSLGGAVKVAIMGTAKAGKSTMINALLGAEFLPVATTIETAAVVLIQHSEHHDHTDGVLYTFNKHNTRGGVGVELARGASAINSKLRAINLCLRNQAKAVAEAQRGAPPADGGPGGPTSGCGPTPSRDPKLEECRQVTYTLGDGTSLPVYVPQLVLRVKFPASLTAGDGMGRFDMYDTPGPNEAEVGARSMVDFNVRQVLKNADVVVFVVNFTNMGTEDEEALLRLVASECGPDFPALVFVANKVDQRTHADGETVEQLLNRRRRQVVESSRFMTALSNLAGDECGDAMLPITATHALGAKLVQSGHGSEEIARELLSAVSKYSLGEEDSTVVFSERIMPHMLARLSAADIKTTFRETCDVLLRQCKFAQFEGFLRQRVAIAHAQLLRHLDEYIRLVLQEMAKYYTADNEVVQDDEYVLTQAATADSPVAMQSVQVLRVQIELLA